MLTGVSSSRVMWQSFLERYTRLLMEANPKFPIYFLNIYSVSQDHTVTILWPTHKRSMALAILYGKLHATMLTESVLCILSPGGRVKKTTASGGTISVRE